MTLDQTMPMDADRTLRSRLGRRLRPRARRQRRAPRPRRHLGAGLLRRTSARAACSPSPCPPSSAAWAPRSARSRSSSASSPSTAARPRWRCRCTSTSPRSPRGATGASLPGAEATLRRVADEGIVLVSTGGADFTHPRGTAVKVDGGYRVSGRKIFASQSPAGTVMSTMFAVRRPRAGPRVLNMAVPFGDGVTVLDNWDTLGMRGTASNDVVDRRRVRARRAGARRPPVRRRRPAAAGDRQHRLPDHLGRLPRRRRGGGRRTPSLAAARQGRRPDRAAPGRADGAPAPRRRVGARRRARRRRRRSRRRRWRRWPR